MKADKRNRASASKGIQLKIVALNWAAHLVFIFCVLLAIIPFFTLSMLALSEGGDIWEVLYLIGGWWGFAAILWSYLNFKALCLVLVPSWVWLGYCTGLYGWLGLWLPTINSRSFSLEKLGALLLFAGWPVAFAMLTGLKVMQNELCKKRGGV